MTQTVAIVGAGLIGKAWAIVFARAGWRVTLYDPAAGAVERCRAACGADLKTLARHGLSEAPGAALERIRGAASLEEALRGAAHVQESGPEDVAAKTEIFAALDRFAETDAILASSTSALQASLFTEALAGRGRCLVAHPVNPPHLVPVVELCGAPWTSEATLALAHERFESVGQVPIRVRREVDGFVLNRLQAAVLTEAFRLVAEGVVSPDDLDKTVRDGLGLRWSFMGPFETIDLNAPGGTADYCARYGAFYKRFASDMGGPQIWSQEGIEKVLAALDEAPAGAGGGASREARMAERDARLAALTAHKARR